MRRVLIEQAGRQGADQAILERQLTEERIKRHDLEGKVRELEIKSLKDGGRDDASVGGAAVASSADTGRAMSYDHHGVPNSDYALLVNSLIHLITKEAEPLSERQRPLTD